MATPTGFKQVKRAVIEALKDGRYQHEARNDINVKNLLATGEVTANEVIDLLRRSNGMQYEVSPHHSSSAFNVHIITVSTWYVKFYFLDPDTWFISVHQ